MTPASTIPTGDFRSVFPALHEPFLRRASDPAEAGDGREALGAFLALRLVDRTADRSAEDDDGLAYQARAAKEYLDDLAPSEEVTHLREIVRIAAAVGRGRAMHLLCAPLLAYAYWLEQQLRLDEALDVVETAQRVKDLLPQEVVSSLLQRARIQRLAGRLEGARDAYAAARTRADEIGDRHSVLLSRIGDAIVARQLGNLPASEAALRDVLRDAEAWGDRDAQARAHHDLGVALSYRDRPAEAIPHLYAAFDLYEPDTYKLRALSDLGLAFKKLHHAAPATRAFTLVLERARSMQVRIYAMLELLELAALTSDRMGFQRWARKLGQLEASFPPETRADFEVKLGVGHCIFGNVSSAQRHLGTAIRVAEEWRLNDYLFRAEKALRELEARAQPQVLVEAPPAECNDPAVRSVAESVFCLSDLS